ncbi:DUF3426 domain-containing protein [Pseudomonas sp. MAG002Y]|uniref:DUF3426 domain-containing protein n=1 Tax=Pseudomonas sp. MAG002Y TaxID=2678690 RepID=UPI001C60F233|nr:DUF3426 domain-containing protein [Pseudomonas sp. MAG002Y]MBW5415572.1 DUF3426 domain-containing protein [Pseudomonas sp. MAG002Y]
MTETYVTQCPHCSTRFRVKQEHLAIAQGNVRCGACLEIFDATQHLEGLPTPLKPVIESTAVVIQPAPPMAQSPSTQPQSISHVSDAAEALPKYPSDTLLIHDDLDLDGLDLDEELAKLDAMESAQRLPPLPTFGQQKPASKTTPAYDESWAEALLREESAESDNEQRQEPTLTLDTIEEDHAHEEPSLGLHASHEADEPELESSLRADEKDNHDQPIEAAEPHVGDTAPSDREATPVRAEPALRNDTLLDLHDEPLQLDWQPPKKQWAKRLGWVLLNLVALFGLFAQYVGFHFDELARQDQYRPWFVQFCAWADCKVPSKVDVKQIRSSNLVVRSHPEFSGALQVDAILYNRATFSQPFPLLELRFADLNGQLIASRRFKPWEYLGGELKGQTEMPPQTPIHISLDILDPGSRAVNYSLSFHSPE